MSAATPEQIARNKVLISLQTRLDDVNRLEEEKLVSREVDQLLERIQASTGEDIFRATDLPPAASIEQIREARRVLTRAISHLNTQTP